jgi:hypothetical protein
MFEPRSRTKTEIKYKVTGTTCLSHTTPSKRPVSVKHCYHEDGFHRVFFGNYVGGGASSALHDMDTITHGPCLSFSLVKTREKSIAKKIDDRITIVLARLKAEGKELPSEEELKQLRVLLKNSDHRYKYVPRGNRGDTLPRADGTKADKVVSISINLGREENHYHRITVLEAKMVSILGLSSKKIWFAVLKDKESWMGRKAKPTVLAVKGFRRVPRKWVPEFKELMLPRD